MTRARIIRRLSLLVLIGWLALLAGLLIERQLRRVSVTDASAGGNGAGPTGERAQRVHRGFEYLVTIGSDPNFRIAAQEAVEYESGWYELHDVEIALYHAGEVAYGLTAQRARFNQTEQEARVEGTARLSLRGGVVVNAEGYTVRGPERIVESTSPVTFAGPGWGGVAGSLASSLTADTISLIGDVSVSARSKPDAPASILLAPRIDYARRQATARFPEGLTVLRGALRLTSPDATVQLLNESLELRRLMLSQPVKLDGDAGGPMEATAGDTVIEPRGEKLALVAQAAANGWAEARWRQAGSGWRELSARRLVGEGTAEAWQWLEGQDDACALEERPDQPPFSVEAERIRLDFESGQATEVTASRRVAVEAGERRAKGGELRYSIPSGRFALTPETGARVQGQAPEGELRADVIEGDAGGGATARGQVTGIARRASLWGGGDEPVHFAAMAATVSEDRSRLTLVEDARVWQGERLVRADRLTYLIDEERVLAEGSVVTTAVIAGRDGSAPLPFEARSRTFEYSRPAGQAVYEGNVVATDPRAVIKSQRLTATFGPEGQVSLVSLAGGVDVLERATGRTLRGQRGRLQPPEDLFELWGEPVVVQEASGNQVTGNHLQWHPEAGSVVLIGEDQEPTETLYYPEPTPTPGRRPR